MTELTFPLASDKNTPSGRANLWGQIIVHGTKTGQFNCPNCDALYYLIEAEAGPETDDVEGIECVACDEPLPAREGRMVLKYFLSGRSPRQRKTRKTRKT
jgi:hypothetical protein